MEVTGIIMAGGKSSRMGRDKGLMIYKNKPLVFYPLEVLSNFCDEIIISTNNDEYNKFGYQLIKDKYKDIGPIGGLHSSLTTSKNKWNIVIACDMPFVSANFLNGLISKIHNDFDAIVPQNTNNQYETLCAAYSKSCIPYIEKRVSEKKYGLHSLLQSLKVKILQIQENDRNFINLNTLNEFQRTEKEI